MRLLLRRSVQGSDYYPALLHLSFCICAFLFFTVNTTAAPSADKIITVKVNGSGIISIGRDTISSDDLAMYIRERLFKSYVGTGKMYDAIKLVKEGEPETVVMDVILKEIARGQKKALNELCLEKHKKVFEDISARQKDKLKKNYKVLFQTGYD